MDEEAPKTYGEPRDIDPVTALQELARDASADAVRHIGAARAAEDAANARAMYVAAADDRRLALDAVETLRKQSRR